MKKKKENNKKLLGYMAAGCSAKALQGIKTMAQSVFLSTAPRLFQLLQLNKYLMDLATWGILADKNY